MASSGDGIGTVDDAFASSSTSKSTTTVEPPPKFQLTSRFASPRASIGSQSSEVSGAPGGRRTAGVWRTQWPPSSSNNGKSSSSMGSADGRGSPKRSAGIFDEGESHKVGQSSKASEPSRDTSSLWEPNPSAIFMTPPGTINELPSLGASDDILQSRPGNDVPWSAGTARTGNYDWANFVYAYARGRWDPVRLPQPPNQSNVIPGAITQIGIQTEKFARPSTPEAPASVVEIRRPSLNYTQTSNLDNLSEVRPPFDSEFTLVDRNDTPAPTNQSTISHLDFEGKSEKAVLGKNSNEVVQMSDPPPFGSETAINEPTFVNPFSILQLASSSAPNVGVAATMAEEAQRRIEERDVRNSPAHGAKTDSEVIAREALSRRESQHTPIQDNDVWSKDSLYSPADRQTGVLPFVSPTTVPRPGLNAQMSEFALSDKQSSPEANRRDSLYDQRPRPTPVQFLGANLRAEHTDTWASAPDASQSASTSFSVSSHGHLTTRDDTGSVSGLRRAARRTSVKRTEGIRDMVRDATVITAHSRSFPAANVAEAAIIREVPSLGQIQHQDYPATSERRPDDPLRSLSDGDLAEGSKAIKDSSTVIPPTRSRVGSADLLNTKMPPSLAQIGQTGSNPSMTTYLNVGKRVEQFYRDFGYLPSIIPPDEINRRQALRRYGPPKMHGDTNFDRIGHLVKLVFNTKLVLISLVGEKSQFFQTEVGASNSGFSRDWLQDIAKSRDCSLCSHAILQKTDEPLVILDTEKDWRFAGNPLVKGPPYIRFYAGSPLRTADGYNLGSLCIIDDHPWTEFNPRQRHTLKEFSRVVMREMELSRDTIHLRIRDRMQHSIETFTRECLEMESSETDDNGEENSGLHKVYAFAAKGMREALNASGAIVFDLSHFELVVSSSQSHDEDGGSKIFFPSPYQYPDITPFADFENPESIEGVNLGKDTPLQDHAKLEEKSVPPMAVLGASEIHPAPEDRDRPVPLSHYLKVAEFLRKYRTGHYFPFTPLPFRHLLPPGMTNVLLVPIFGLNKQPFALLCAYSKPTESAASLEDIEEPGLQYLRAMGTIILSAILKKDIMLADKAKSHFISNISHELRTPLHGILAAAELLAETKLNSTQGSYLETVEACGKSLLELVNHVLDFTKLSGNTRANQPHAKPTQKCDLVRLVQEVCESSWIGQMAKKLESEQNSGIGSAYAKGSEASSPSGDSNEPQMSLKDQKQRILHEASSVETVIDISHRSLGWLVKCDAGGIRRVLMNLIGNSLKFTTAGFVHVSVREVQSTETHVVVELGVTDTGKGISRTFLEEQLFHPFTQENHLGPGTGLGLSIVNSIVQSPAINGKIDVWSTLGQGTEIRVTCELELCSQTIEGGSSLYRPTLHVDNKRSVSFVGFQENLRGQSDLKDVLRIYYEDWWKFNIANGIEGDIIVVNDNVDHLEEICAERKLKGRPLPPVIVLTGARGDGRVARACDDYQDAGGLARLLFKPAGPARLEAVTEICLQRLTGQSTGAPESHHSTPLASPHKQKEENGAAYFEDDNRTPLQDDALTPRGHPDVSVGSAATAPGIHRPVASVDLRRNSPHVSPGPPGLPDAVSLLRRHSSGSRVSRVGQRGQSPQSPSNREESLKRPVLPPRSITYHEPNLQRQVLMSPLRSPYSKLSGEANDYFGSVSSNATGSSSMSTSSHEAASPSSPGSVISLEGGEGALLKSAIHTAGLLRGGVSKKRLRILSVEDNSINRKVLAAYFGKLEVDFVEAVNGQDGVDVFESHPPNYFDVIFMDLSMPILDGLGATKEIRKIEAERFRSEDHTSQYQAWSKVTKSSSSLVLSTPGGSRPSVHARAKIFTLTGRSSDEDKRKAFATGADGFIVKPLSFKVLSALLGRISARST